MVIFMVLVLLSGTAAAADWPMFRHDPQHTGVAGESVEPPLELLWKYNTNSAVYSAPSVSGETVYIGLNDGYVCALDATTGTEKWKFETGGRADYSSPAVSGYTVYVVSKNQSDTFYLYALDTTTSAEKWKYEIGSDMGGSPPAVSGGTVYIGMWGLGSGGVCALDADTGSLRWRHENYSMVESSPTLSEGTVYIGSGCYVYALCASTGTEKWKYETGGLAFFNTPAISGSIVYTGSQDNYVYALDAGTGTVKWKYETDGSVSSPAVSEDTVYISSSDGYLYALDANTGIEKWKSETSNSFSPVVSGNTVYVGKGDYVLALDGDTGAEKWKYETDGRVSSSFAVASGTVFVGSYDGYVYAFAPATTTTTPSPPTTPTPTPSVTVLDCSPSPIHGGEDLDVKVSWANIPADWKLVVSLEKAEWDKTRLADDVSMPVSGSGAGTFALNVYPTTETYEYAKVWACFYRGTEWKSVYGNIDMVVLPEPTPTPTPTPSPAPTSYPAPSPTYTVTPTPTATPIQTPRDTSPPAISLQSPVTIEQNDNGLLEEGEKVRITYGATDPGGVTSLRILLDGTMLESRNEAGTYTVTTNSLPVGTHTIRVVATDSKSNTGFEELPITVERTGPSVYFGTTRTTIRKGEDAIFTLSAVNPIGNPPMTVQLILKPPSGVSVTSSSFAKAGSGIYTCTQTIESGDNVRSIEVRLTGGQVGTHEIESEVYYMFESSPKSPTRYDTLTLIVESNPATDFNSGERENRVPGFAAVVAGMALLAIYLRRKRA